MRRRLPIVAVIGAVLVAYAGLLAAPGAEFVYDDVRFVSENDAVRELGNPLVFFTDPETADPGRWQGIYRPLRTLDFAIDWALSGGSPFWFHLRSVLLHALGSVLVLLLLRQWGAGEPAAILGALVFALHPAQAETAAWITSRGDLLCLVFFLGALLLHGRGGRGAFAGAVLVLPVALFSKEVAVMFPAAAFLADFFFRDERRLSTTLRRWPRYLVYGVLVVAWAALWLHLHDVRDGGSWHLTGWWGGSFAGTLLTMSRGFVYYARLVLFPVDMTLDFYLAPVPTPDLLTLACAAAVASALVAAIVSAFRGGGAVAFAVLWFFVTIFPTSNLPGPIGIPTAERFLYLPMVGVALPLGLLLARAWRAAAVGRVLVVVLLLCLGAVTADRAAVWATADSLWERTLARTESPRGLQRRAWVLREAAWACADPAEERRLLLESLDVHDRLERIWETLPVPGEHVDIARTDRWTVVAALGRGEEALRGAESILERRPGLAQAGAARAFALLATGRRREATAEMNAVVDGADGAWLTPVAARLYRAVGESYRVEGNPGLARWSLRRAEDISGDPVAVRHLAEIDAEFNERYVPLERARAKNPGDVEARLRLAELNARYGRFREAGHRYGELLRRAGSNRPPELLFSQARWFHETQDTPASRAAAAALYREILATRPDWRKAEVEERLRIVTK
ncbi:MAG: hypothetical protein ABFS86_03150 [Planctomycetota bacterium]